MVRLYLTIPDEERLAIENIAKEEIRTFQDQILYFLRDKLREEGAISKDDLEKNAKLPD